MSRDRDPEYAIIARSLREQILRGDFEDGRALPTEAELSATFGVSRQTVRRAFHDLVVNRLVYRVPGRGTFVRHDKPGYVRQFGSVSDLMALAEDTTLQIIEPLTRVLDAGAAERLGLSDHSVYSVHFTRRHDESVFCATSVYLPPDIGLPLMGEPELTTVGARSPFTIIGRVDTHAAIARAEQSITAEAAGLTIARELGCVVGTPVLRVDRVYFDSSDHAVELAISRFLPERYTYRINLMRSTQ